MCTLLHVLATPPFCPKTVMNIMPWMMNCLKDRVLYLESNSCLIRVRVRQDMGWMNKPAFNHRAN